MTLRAFLYNNGRKLHGLPMHRKLNKKKRYCTRKNSEAVFDFIDWTHS